VTNFAADMIESLNDGWSIDSASIEGLSENYDFPNREARHVTINHGLPLMYWRSVGHSFTAFAKETMIDELAEQIKVDPVDFRISNTETNPRLQNVIRVAGERMKEMGIPAGHGLGFAAHGSFQSDVAQVAQVSVENGKIKVHKVVCVIDCGQAVNPDIIKGQIEGSIMFGLTAALYGDIHLENGVVKESNFHDYPILRMNEAPEVEVIIVQSQDAPTGVGEPGLPPIAPAVANAVFQVTGQRLKSLPLSLA
jgi:isoquinoline 1-oxidoreductase/isoquinoline 1-oxidoreductase beta subunit